MNIARLCSFVSLITLLSVGVAWASDVATFENLGFSSDGKYFAFGQYGALSNGRKIYSQIGIVNVKSNEYIPKGTFSSQYSFVKTASQSPLAALLLLYQKALPKIHSAGINHLSQGQAIYIRLLSGTAAPGGSTINLPIKINSPQNNYVMSLMQNSGPSGAAFSISIAKIVGSTTSKYSTGSSTFYRKGVSHYSIYQVILSPNKKQLAIIVEKQLDDGSARYMVETVHS